MSEPHIKYFDMGPYPVCMGFTTSKKQFNKEMLRLGVEKKTHKFDKVGGHAYHLVKGGQSTIVLTMPPRAKDISMPAYLATVVHECVHAWQFVLDHMGTGCPAGEFQAYGIQFLSQLVFNEVISSEGVPNV